MSRSRRRKTLGHSQEELTPWGSCHGLGFAGNGKKIKLSSEIRWAPLVLHPVPRSPACSGGQARHRASGLRLACARFTDAISLLFSAVISRGTVVWAVGNSTSSRSCRRTFLLKEKPLILRTSKRGRLCLRRLREPGLWSLLCLEELSHDPPAVPVCHRDLYDAVSINLFCSYGNT